MNNLRQNFNKYKNSPLVKGTLILTIASFITRIIGFLFRIFLTHKIGAEGLGIYQLIFPIQLVCYAISCSGVELAISRLTAAHKSCQYLKYGLLISLLAGIFCSIFIYVFAPYICTNIIFEPRCENLIRVLAFMIPFSCIHACISSYFIGRKQVRITALGQMIEQISRVLAITFFIYLFEYLDLFVSPLCAVLGSLCGEICSTIFCILKFYFHSNSCKGAVQSTKKTHYFTEILTLSVPVTLNRLMLSILQSIQSVLIPSMLILYGLSSKESLEIYGILLGLVLPFLLFPGALINAYSTLLLPEISKAQSCNDLKKIERTTKKTIYFCSIFGMLCSFLFIVFGNLFGIYLLHSKMAGTFVCELGIVCPFIYLNQTLSSIVNGLGKTGITFLLGTFCTVLQILLIVKLMPAIGIAGYIISFFVTNALNSALLFGYVYKKV